MIKDLPLVAVCERLATSLEAVKIASRTPILNKEWFERLERVME